MMSYSTNNTKTVSSSIKSKTVKAKDETSSENTEDYYTDSNDY